MWQDSRALGRGPVSWELFKTAFLDRFFPREMKEAKVEDFINLKQGSMIVREYSLKFVKLSRYATSLVSYSRDEMSGFLMRILGDMEDDCRYEMLHDSMDLSKLMVQNQQGHQRSGKSNSQRIESPRGGRPGPKKGNRGDLQHPKRECAKCDLTHSAKCRQGTYSLFSRGKSWHMVKDCPQNRGQAGRMLSLGLIHKVQQQSSLLRGTYSTP
ncbi:uncharacterized protein LOC107024990 [Solanum pennellii]|uniref:Uncharacterized protein LOC107024990 n=1 Tax=Solanum pennellii TaxID=28526 RepID=A0ABM1H796_SOLPN|nr:uncharacterized protein LOC107024990 [Solanum pennellii]